MDPAAPKAGRLRGVGVCEAAVAQPAATGRILAACADSAMERKETARAAV